MKCVRSCSDNGLYYFTWHLGPTSNETIFWALSFALESPSIISTNISFYMEKQLIAINFYHNSRRILLAVQAPHMLVGGVGVFFKKKKNYPPPLHVLCVVYTGPVKTEPIQAAGSIPELTEIHYISTCLYHLLPHYASTSQYQIRN